MFPVLVCMDLWTGLHIGRSQFFKVPGGTVSALCFACAGLVLCVAGQALTTWAVDREALDDALCNQVGNSRSLH